MRIILLATFLLAAPGLAAQSHDPELILEVGDEVRFRGPLRRDPLTRAVVRELGPQYLRFTVEDRPGVVFVRSYENLETVDVKTISRRESIIDAATWGVYIGAAAGAVAGPLLASALSMETGSSIAVVGVGAGVVGGLIGSAVGTFLSPVRWRRYLLD